MSSINSSIDDVGQFVLAKQKGSCIVDTSSIPVLLHHVWRTTNRWTLWGLFPIRFASELVIGNTQYINVIKSNINTQKKCVSKTSQKICSFRRLQFLVGQKRFFHKKKKVQPNGSSFAKTTWYFFFLTFLAPETLKFSVW